MEGLSPYEKLKTLRTLSNNRIKVCNRLQRWWDEELSVQLKKTSRRRKGKEGEWITQEGRVRRWKLEKEKIRLIVREKKKEFSKRFCEENGDKDPWEIVKWAKDPWRIREVMKSLPYTNNNLLYIEQEKAEGLIRAHVVWNKGGRKTEEEEEERDSGKVEEGSLEEMITKVEIAFSGT